MSVISHPQQPVGHGVGHGGVTDWLRESLSTLRHRISLKWLLLIAALVVAAVVAIVLTSGGGGGGNPVSASQFDQVKLGMPQSEVSSLLGDPQRTGSKQFEVSQPSSGYGYVSPGTSTVTERNCWFYPVSGNANGSIQHGPGATVTLGVGGNGPDEAVICFDSAQTVSVASGPMSLGG
jgi:hypothetical protein